MLTVDNSKYTVKQLKEKIIEGFLSFSSMISILTTLGIVAILIVESIGFFKEVSLVEFFADLKWAPLYQPRHFGILPLIAGTILTSAIACFVAIPLGLLIAIYLSQYASKTIRAIIKPLLEVLVGIPTVVYGYFALTMMTPFLKNFFPDIRIFNALSAGLVMGIMIIPVVSSLSEDAMSAVPKHLKEGALALGATKLDATIKVIIPASLSGIIASFILAISRAVGETMIVALAAGATPNLTLNPLESVQTMTGYIVQVSLGDTPFGSIGYKTIFAVALLLFLLTLVLNIIGKMLVGWEREIY
ncbi:MAG: phosphate ABC transporter permease subunit PstC [Actinobacteria bacterium]|nr:phosphate ABC transporter permease subunit PstC [Actinomycetota bacterium]